MSSSSHLSKPKPAEHGNAVLQGSSAHEKGQTVDREPSRQAVERTHEEDSLEQQQQQPSNGSTILNVKPIRDCSESNSRASNDKVSSSNSSLIKREDKTDRIMAADKRSTVSYSAKISENRERDENESDEDADDVNDHKNPKSSPPPAKKEETKKPQVLSFIHKLYSMLEEPELDNLIWWHENNSNFLISPNEEFSKTLSNYFKHANIASFIRQLNMYGFHKVNDSTHSASSEDTTSQSQQSQTQLQSSQSQGEGNSDSNDRPSLENTKMKSKGSSSNNSPVWEFKHSSGIFRKGNLEALNTIKRRSFKNPISDKEVHNLKLTYDLPPNIVVQSDSNNIPHHMINNLPMQQQQQHRHHSHQHPPPHPSLQPMLSQQALEFQHQHQSQSRPQPQQAQQAQHQQPPLMLHQSSVLSQTEHDFPDDRGNMMMNNQFQPINMSEPERNGLIANIRDLQQSNNELQVRFNALAQKTDEAMKLNDIFKEELSNVNYDFVSALELLKEQLQCQQSKSPNQSPSQSQSHSHSRSQSQGEMEPQSLSQSQSRILSAVENIRSKVLERIAYRDMNFKSISYQYSLSDPSTQFNPQGPHQSFSMTQPPFHMLQTPYSSANSTVLLPRTQSQTQRSGSQPTLNSQNSAHTMTTPQHQIQQIRHLSTPSPGVNNLPQHNIAMTSLPPESGLRNPSATSLTSNPYYNQGYPQIPTVYNYLPDYSQQQIQQQQLLSQPLLNKSLSGNTKSNSSSTTKVPTSGSISNPHSSSFIQQNGPTSNPQPFHSQKVNSSNNNEDSPFLHKDIRYSVSLSSDRSRNASVYDPLQPLPLVPPLPMQIIGNQTNMSGPNPTTGAVQFYQNGQNFGAYPVMDPNSISRQYSLTQMYSPVGQPQSSLNVSVKRNAKEESFSNNENVNAKQMPGASTFEGRSQTSTRKFSEPGNNVSPRKHIDSFSGLDTKVGVKQVGEINDVTKLSPTNSSAKDGNASNLKSGLYEQVDSTGTREDYNKSRSEVSNSPKDGDFKRDGEQSGSTVESGSLAKDSQSNFQIEENSKRPAVHHILNHGHVRNVDGSSSMHEGSECNSKNSQKGYAKESRQRIGNTSDNDEGRDAKKMKI